MHGDKIGSEIQSKEEQSQLDTKRTETLSQQHESTSIRGNQAQCPITQAQLLNLFPIQSTTTTCKNQIEMGPVGVEYKNAEMLAEQLRTREGMEPMVPRPRLGWEAGPSREMIHLPLTSESPDFNPINMRLHMRPRPQREIQIHPFQFETHGQDMGRADRLMVLYVTQREVVGV